MLLRHLGVLGIGILNLGKITAPPRIEGCAARSENASADTVGLLLERRDHQGTNAWITPADYVAGNKKSLDSERERVLDNTNRREHL